MDYDYVQKLNCRIMVNFVIQVEFDILNIVSEDPLTSQRQIAEQSGISLGQVNFLIKKFVAKGLVKIERQTAKSVQYHLTPKGMSAIAEKTLVYIKNSYSTVIEMTNNIKRLGNTYSGKGYHIYLHGSRDEMMELCKMALRDGKISYTIGLPDRNEDAVVFCWEKDIESGLKDYKTLNLLG